MQRPVIAITPEALRIDRAEGRGAYCGATYSRAVELAGGVPVLIPLTNDPSVLDYFLQHGQGLLLTGGGDMSQSYYSPLLSDAERATIKGTDETRDVMEVYLVREALDADLPVLGICRGLQVMNVAAGGTLHPDIALRLPGAVNHRHPDPFALAHAVTWEPEARLTEILGSGCEFVNSTHHQAVNKIAPGFDVVARAEDGVIEAMERGESPFFCGVQFHPERLVERAPQFLRLFEAFVEAARSR
jgi:putative glutamine amidotransferase